MKTRNEKWQWCYNAMKKCNSEYQVIVYCELLDDWIVLVDTNGEYKSHEALRSMNRC